MSRYEFKFVVSGEGVELSEADVERIGQTVAQSGVTAVAEAEGTPEIPQSAIVGWKKSGVGCHRPRCGSKWLSSLRARSTPG